ncbi:MFS transporter [Curtobacterium sp. VKM Ac-2887]|uniref:MFS transporter n=1 Tax=Curtobacterium sp. VKM Ac-2887 TaxID=2783819 RepID=UPI00188C706B|nr:MFS transporter [Curtobacterium sp. VKM Ac-2887]MBF4585676.1 MFS transporter [Curtobacterium sp. VKM Ac-2887]
MSKPSDRGAVLPSLGAVFLAAGLLLGSWASRTPAVAGALHVDATVVSSFVIALAAGSGLGLLVATRDGRRIGPRAGVRAGAVLQLVGLAGIGVGAEGASSVPVTIAAVFVFGTGVGLGDVLMNVEAAGAEQAVGRSVLPRLHALFSLGAMGGAIVGAVSAGVGLPISVQFPAVAVIGTVVVLFAAGRFSGPTRSTVVGPSARAAAQGVPVRSVARRLLLVAVTVLGLAFAEGTATSWISLGTVRGHGLDATTGAVAYGVFVTAMTATRFVGGRIVDRFGRMIAIRVAIGATVLGLLVFAIAPGLVGILIAALLWGAGCALGVPLGVSAAADGGGDPRRVAVVSATAYTGALALPALLGPLFDRWGYGVGLVIPVIVLVVGFTVSRVFRTVVPAESR